MINKVYDVAIVGGGIIGLAIAHALQNEKAEIAVIDGSAHLPPATDAAAGMLAPSFEHGIAANETLYQFGARSLAMWPDFTAMIEEQSGQEVDFRDDGVLCVAFEEHHAHDLANEAEAVAARGGDIEILTAAQARALEPGLSPNVLLGAFAKSDAQVDPRKMRRALHDVVAARGAAFFYQQAVEIKSGAAFTIVLDDREEISAARIVIASGAAADLAPGDLPAPPIYPVKGEAVALSMPDGALRRVVRAPGAYLCPKAGNRLVIGATEQAHQSDYAVDAAAIAGLIARGAAAAPLIAGLKELERWAGLRPATPDGAPILGVDPRGPDGAYLALGHHRNGILLAPGSAAALAPEILGGEADRGLAAFRPDRPFPAQYG